MRIEETPAGLVIESASETETDRLGAALASLVEPGCVIALEGALGAGKTRLTRAIAESLGVDPAAVSSPTYVLIHEYSARLPIYHFDAYRLDDAEAFEALGVGEYWDAGGLCLVEWADRVAEALPPDHWRIEIQATGPTTRSVRLSGGIVRSIVDQLKHRLQEV